MLMLLLLLFNAISNDAELCHCFGSAKKQG
jgi:hypothetical protein